MTARNGSGPPERRDDVPRGEGNFSPEVVAMLKRRSESFVAYTQRKGMPITYGTRKEPSPEPTTPPKGKRRKS